MNRLIITGSLLVILISIINQVSSIATAFGDNLREHRRQCALTVKDKGPRKNKKCAFPFRFDGKLYKGVCTNEKDPDGLYWCSTRVNRKSRNHIGGKGHWGYCKPGCENRPDLNTTLIEEEGEQEVTLQDVEEPLDRVNDSLIKPCTGANYDVDFWKKSNKKLAPHTGQPIGWYHKETANGQYLPTEAEGTCGEKASFGYIICPPGQECSAKQGAYPFIAAIGYKRKIRGVPVTRYACGGALINRRYVITAAHCQGAESKNKIAEVVLGEFDLSKNPDCAGKDNNGKCWKPVQRFNIGSEDVILHENWNPLTVVNEGYDIALIRLPRPAYTMNEMCETPVFPICLPLGLMKDGTEIKLPLGPKGKEYITMGWGRTNNLRGDSGDKKEGGAYKNVLQKLALPAIDIRKCRNNPAWRSFHRITPDRQLCAGGEIHADSCAGDSGGPLMIQKDTNSKMYLAGIVSFGKRKCGTGFPGVYTDITYYIDWIKGKLQP